MDLHYELFRDADIKDLRAIKGIILECMQLYFPDYKVMVKENEIIIKDYPDEKLPIRTFIMASRAMMNYSEVQQYIYTRKSRLLWKKKKVV